MLTIATPVGDARTLADHLVAMAKVIRGQFVGDDAMQIAAVSLDTLAYALNRKRTVEFLKEAIDPWTTLEVERKRQREAALVDMVDAALADGSLEAGA